MNHWHDVEIAEERRKEMLRAADQRRLARMARPPRRPLYRRVLAWVGCRLITWGARLRARFDVSGTANAPQTAC